MTLLERHRRNQRKRQAVAQAYIDRQAIETGACEHCPWRTTGAACTLPRCLLPKCYEPPRKDGANDIRG